MTAFQGLVHSQQQVAYCPHTSTSGEVWQLVRRGACTSAGASNGTTLIDTGLTVGADTYTGRYWIEILSGACKGQWKRIVDDNGTGTLTLENNGFSAQIASAVEFNLWFSPDPVVVVDSSGGATNVVDAVRAEADDFWNGYWLVVISGTRRGQKAQVTDFTSSTGTFVVGTGLAGALSAGDVCVLRKFIEAEVTLGVQQEYVARQFNRINFSRGGGIPGARSGTIGLKTHVRPSGSLAATGVKANKPECSGLFQAAGMTETVNTSATVGAGSTTTAVKINTASWENFTIGGLVMYDGNAAFIESMEDGGVGVDTLNVNPPLPAAPASSDTIYASTMYALDTAAAQYGALVEIEIDGVRHTLTGCKGNVSMESGAVPMFNWQLSVDHWIREREASPLTNATSAYSTVAPVLEKDLVAYLDTTATNIGGLTATPGAAVAPRKVQGSTGINGRTSFQTITYAPGGTFRELISASGDALSQDQYFADQTSRKLSVVFGSHGSAFAVRVPAMRLVETPTPVDEGGLSAAPSVFEAHDAGTATDGASDVQKMPDFSLHFT